MIMPQESLSVEPVQVLGDNYVWMIALDENRYVAVDPGAADPVRQWLTERDATLSHILLTHHHSDHCGGVADLKAVYNAKVIGNNKDKHRLPRLDQTIEDGQQIKLGPLTAKAIETPGHTIGHVVYVMQDALFAGDTLFSLGCGRLFEGSAAMMWQSLKKIQALPDSTRLFCAHEYTLTNHGFAIALEPDNQGLLELQKELMEKNDANRPTLPTTLAHEKLYNPFLRSEDKHLAKKLDLENDSPITRFAKLREKRNNY